ncbi:MAG: nucleotide-binding domain-containing protein [Candidatus Levyibacteriota bacterium]
MANLKKSFDTFLQNIEPDKETKQYAIKAHTPIREHLENDEDFKEYFQNSFLYGSYARYTTVGEIKDIDIVVVTKFDNNDEEHTPRKVLAKLKKALNRYYETDNTEYQRKSIKVKDPLPDNPDVKMTLDVIPAIANDGEDKPLLVPDREDGEWVFSHPKGHISFTSMLNDKDHGNGMFVPFVKIFRYWWLYTSKKKHPMPKGFWLECLSGVHFDHSCTTYAEHFIAVLENISEKYKDFESYAEPPLLADPGLPKETLKTSMTIEEFKSFMEAVNKSLARAVKARDEDDEHKSSLRWRKVFGGLFPMVEKKTNIQALELIIPVVYPSENEQFLEDLGIETREGGYHFKIDCRVVQDGFRPFLLSLGGFLKKKLSLTFFVKESNIPVPYRVMWKVKNTGEEAKTLGQLRGEITETKGYEKPEGTMYKGTHYVECYAIDNNNICIAKYRMNVVIQ